MRARGIIPSGLHHRWVEIVADRNTRSRTQWQLGDGGGGWGDSPIEMAAGSIRSKKNEFQNHIPFPRHPKGSTSLFLRLSGWLPQRTCTLSYCHYSVAAPSPPPRPPPPRPISSHLPENARILCRGGYCVAHNLYLLVPSRWTHFDANTWSRSRSGTRAGLLPGDLTNPTIMDRHGVRSR